MKTNKLCVNQQDYEHYLIPLPMNALFGKKRKSYLLSELEKMHPCFSDDFCFDTKLKFEKRHLFFDVVVISKMKLAEYRRKLKKYSAGVRFENLSRMGFFEKRIYLGTCFVLFLIVCVFLFVENYQRKNKITSECIVPESNPVIIAPQKLMKVNEFCLKFFEIILKNEGIVNNFEWKTDGYKEKISCELENIYPEQFGSFLNVSDFSEIKYVNGIPCVSFSGEEKLANENIFLKKDRENSELYNCIRNVFKESGVKVISEKRMPYSVNFIFSKETDVINELNKILNIYNASVSEVKINYSNENCFSMEVTLCQDFSNSDGLNISILSDFKGLFIPGYKEKEHINNDNETSFYKKTFEKQYVSPNSRKIGEVRYKDGRKVVYYKTEDNKTVKRYE